MRKPNQQSVEHQFEGGTFVAGDAFCAVPLIGRGTVDLAITSPPYFMGKDYDRSMSVKDFEDEIGRMQKLIYEAVKSGGSICWQIGSHVQDNITVPLDFLVYKICSDYNDLKLRNRVVWTFEHGINSTKRLSGRHETVLWFTKGDEYSFDLDAIRVPQKYPGKRYYKGDKKGELSGNPLGKNPGDVWTIPNVKANHVEKTAHPCQFPVALVSRFIKALTSSGDTVLDPFAGSGSTAIAALECDRKFKCIELNDEYVDIALNRIQAWYDGSGKVRPDVPVLKPDPKWRVSARPKHFLA